MRLFRLTPFILLLSLLCCKEKSEDLPSPISEMYFPPISNENWETTSMESLGWNTTEVNSLKEYLIQKNTKSFMILVNGRIVMEEYFNGHTKDARWQWNSAGKTLVSETVGIAEQEGYLSLTNKASDYLGTGWTSAPLEKENLINSMHLLSMTTGLTDTQLVTPSTLNYQTNAGERWSYSNVFQRLIDIVAASTNRSFDTYFTEKLKSKIGMEGFWNFGAIYKIYHSNTRSMARFGLLALTKGKWEDQQIINETYFNTSVQSSQDLNPAYGYLWWLNGKSSFKVPTSDEEFQGFLIPNAPADMYAAMGAEDQRIYVVPSKDLVVIRMGEASNPLNPSFAISGFDNELWSKINAIIK